MTTKTVKEVNVHTFLVCAYKSQDFAQSQENFAWLHDRETVTFRNSVGIPLPQLSKMSSRSWGWMADNIFPHDGAICVWSAAVFLDNSTIMITSVISPKYGKCLTLILRLCNAYYLIILDTIRKLVGKKIRASAVMGSASTYCQRFNR